MKQIFSVILLIFAINEVIAQQYEIFFMADYRIISEEDKDMSYADYGLSIGQIFTHKKNADLQSLVLLRVYKLNPVSNNYEEMAGDHLIRKVIPQKQTYRFKLVLACMSRHSKSPSSEQHILSAKDIIPSELGVFKSEADKVILKYQNSINNFVNDNLPRPITQNDNIIENGPRPRVN
jgi:hypothetical protein